MDIHKMDKAKNNEIQEVEIYSDGVNADKYASDYKKITTKTTSEETMEIKLAPGGGWAARIFKEKPENSRSRRLLRES